MVQTNMQLPQSKKIDHCYSTLWNKWKKIIVSSLEVQTKNLLLHLTAESPGLIVPSREKFKQIFHLSSFLAIYRFEIRIHLCNTFWKEDPTVTFRKLVSRWRKGIGWPLSSSGVPFPLQSNFLTNNKWIIQIGAVLQYQAIQFSQNGFTHSSPAWRPPINLTARERKRPTDFAFVLACAVSFMKLIDTIPVTRHKPLAHCAWDWWQFTRNSDKNGNTFLLTYLYIYDLPLCVLIYK